MINISQINTLKSPLILRINLTDISKRYQSEVEKFVASIEQLNNNQYMQEDISIIIAVTSKLLCQDFCMEHFIKYDFINFPSVVKKFYGEFGFIKRLIDCEDRKMQRLIGNRITYFINRLSKEFGGEGLTLCYGDPGFLPAFRKEFGKILLNLCDNGLRCFMYFQINGLDLSNRVFKNANFTGASFDSSNLENTQFRNCSLDGCYFAQSNTMTGVIVDDKSTLKFTCFHSKFVLLNMQITANTNLLRYLYTSNKEDELSLLHINNYIMNGLDSLSMTQFEEFKDIYNNKIIGDEYKYNINDTEYTIILQCNISLERVLLSELCGVRYKKIIQLYSAPKLMVWMQQKLECPLRKKLDYIKDNILNLKDIKELLCR